MHDDDRRIETIELIKKNGSKASLKVERNLSPVRFQTRILLKESRNYDPVEKKR